MRSRISRRAAGCRIPRRLGILGGTFDPIHVAHLRCAEEVREALDLDQILFIPAASPPHKRGRAVATAADRVAMVRLATAGNPAFRASRLEIDRAGRSYSIDTLRSLRQRSPDRTHLVLLMGLDAFLEIGTWKEFRALFSLADVAVMSRPSYRLTTPRALLPVVVRGEFCYTSDRKSLVHQSGHRVLFLNVTPLEISASAIRLRLQRGQSVRHLVPPTVERYLHRKRLYEGGSASS